MASIIPNQTTLLKSMLASDTFVPLSSVANINKGDVVFVDSEAMPTSSTRPSVTGNVPGVFVVRTGRAASHGVGALVYTGPPSAFVTVDPVGVPAAGSQPWVINILNGRVWVAQGDEAGPGAANRFWQLQTTTPGIGAFGVRTLVASPQ